MAFVPSASIIDCASVLLCVPKATTVIVVASIFLPLAVTGTGSSSSSGVLLVPSVGDHNRASAAWSLTPARCRSSKSNSDRQSHIHSRDRADLPAGAAKFKIY